MVDIPRYCTSLEDSLFGQSYFPNVLGESWAYLVLLAILGLAFFNVLLYFASQLFRIPKLEAWARFELFQVFANAVLLIFIAGWVYGMCHWDASFLYKMMDGDAAQAKIDGIISDCGLGEGAELTPYCAAQSYLDRVKTRGDDIYQILIGVNYVLSYIFKMTWNSSPMGIGYSIEPLAGLQQLMNVFLVTISGFIISYLSVLIQMRVLDFFLIAMPFYFIPLGILMRSFAPTREFGGAVLGFAFASLLFYPLILVMDDLLVYSSFEAATQNAHEVLAQMQTSELSPENDAWIIDENYGMYEPSANAEGMLAERADAGADRVSRFFTQAPAERMKGVVTDETFRFGQTLFFANQVVFTYIIAAVILPIINFMVYIELARQMSAFLGTQMDLTNITRMI